jgi:hypothetical protein
MAPSVIEVVGQTGSQAPQEMHSSVIFIAIVFSPMGYSAIRQVFSTDETPGDPLPFSIIEDNLIKGERQMT